MSDADRPTEPAAPPAPGATPDPASARLALACRGAATALPATFASTFLRLALLHAALAGGTLLVAAYEDPAAEEASVRYVAWAGWIAPFAADLAFWVCLAFAARRAVGADAPRPRSTGAAIASCLIAGGIWKFAVHGSNVLVARGFPDGASENPYLWFAAATALRAVHSLGMFAPAAATLEGRAPFAALKRSVSIAIGVAVAAGFAWAIVRAATVWTAGRLSSTWFAGPTWADYAGALGTHALFTSLCDALRASAVGGAYAALTRAERADLGAAATPPG